MYSLTLNYVHLLAMQQQFVHQRQYRLPCIDIFLHPLYNTKRAGARARNWRKTFVRGNEMGLIKIGTKPPVQRRTWKYKVIGYTWFGYNESKNSAKQFWLLADVITTHVLEGLVLWLEGKWRIIALGWDNFTRKMFFKYYRWSRLIQAV